VVNRLCDALFVFILRSHLAALGPEEPNWLRALVEPQIAEAVELIHEEPGAAWSVAGLAAAVGMSRSAFAARFAQAVGEGPMQYLTRWRVQKAAAMLRRGDGDIGQVAASVGYGSEAAFSKAFKRTMGTTPGAYRRARASSPGLTGRGVLGMSGVVDPYYARRRGRASRKQGQSSARQNAGLATRRG
jgi:AraC-like DNA-binding protein